MKSERSFHALALLLLAALVALLYAPTLDDEWHLDDLAELTPAVRAFAPDVDPSHYRGNAVRWLWAVDYRLHGEDPAGYHVTNAALHLAAAALVYALAWMLAPAGAARRWTAMAAALVFCAHPLATQAVTYLTQRSTSAAAVAFLAALCGWIAFRRGGGSVRWAAYAGSLALLAAGLHTKHVAALAPAGILLAEWAFAAPRRREFVFLAPFVLLAGVRVSEYVPQVETAFRAAAPRPAAPASPHASPAEYAWTQPRVVAMYLGRFILPVGQNVDADVRPSRSPFNPATLGAAGVLAALALAAWRVRKRRPTVAFGTGLFFLALLPTSSFIPSADLYFEHRAYLPMAGLCLAAAGLGAGAARRWPRAAWGVLAAVVVTLGAATLHRNAVWDTELSLWTDAVAKSPGKARPHLNLGVALRDAGRLAEAEAQYRRALEIRPGWATAHNNLGNVLRATGRGEEAEQAFRDAVATSPDYAEPRMNLGNLAMDRGDAADAERWYREALDVAPGLSAARYNLARALETQGRLDEAIPEYARAARERPEDALFRSDLGCARLAAGNLAGAEADLRAAIALREGWEVPWYNLGVALEAQGRAADAAAAYSQALRIRPGLGPAAEALARLRPNLP